MVLYKDWMEVSNMCSKVTQCLYDCRYVCGQSPSICKICFKNLKIFRNVWKISQIINKSYKNIRYLDVIQKMLRFRCVRNSNLN